MVSLMIKKKKKGRTPFHPLKRKGPLPQQSVVSHLSDSQGFTVYDFQKSKGSFM